MGLNYLDSGPKFNGRFALKDLSIMILVGSMCSVAID